MAVLEYSEIIAVLVIAFVIAIIVIVLVQEPVVVLGRAPPGSIVCAGGSFCPGGMLCCYGSCCQKEREYCSEQTKACEERG